MGQEIDELVSQLNNDFSALNLMNLMRAAGVVAESARPQSINFNQLVYLISSTDEVYGKIERSFITEVDTIFVFPDVPWTISRGSINCRVVAADLTSTSADVYSAILFMKIMNKALEGWTLFVLRLYDGIHIGIRVFDRDDSKTCMIGDTDSLSSFLDEIIWVDRQSGFLELYNAMIEVLSPEDLSKTNYDEAAIRKRGYQYDYSESLRLLGKQINIDFSVEIERYRKWFETDVNQNFFREVEEALETLKEVKSSKVNTLEMLFEAEELEKINQDIEDRYAQTHREEYRSEIDTSFMNMANNDPEAMIKLLKAKKGIM